LATRSFSKNLVETGVRRHRIARRRANQQNPVQPSSKKYSAFAVGQITAKDSRILSREEGRWPSSRTLGQVAVDVDALLTNGAEAYGEDVWS
jgi:hypothetical protein